MCPLKYFLSRNISTILDPCTFQIYVKLIEWSQTSYSTFTLIYIELSSLLCTDGNKS